MINCQLKPGTIIIEYSNVSQYNIMAWRASFVGSNGKFVGFGPTAILALQDLLSEENI